MGQEIVVVGGGVIGLTCAWVLAEHGCTVKIVAETFPSTFSGDSQYTSPWAGAHFRPFPSTNEGDLKDFPLTRETFKIMKQLSTEFPECSVRMVKGVDFIEADEQPYSTLSPGYAEGLDNFKIIDSSNLPPGVKFGAEYDSWCLNSPVYLEFLERRLKMYYGVEFIQTNLISLETVIQSYPSSKIINCTGRGLQLKGGYDPACFLVKGETVLVRAPQDCIYKNMTITHRLPNNRYSFVIPRPCDGGIIVGGTREPGQLSSQPDNTEIDTLIKNARLRFPELLVNKNGEMVLDIKKINVGFRPMRTGGVKLEKEVLDSSEIIHCYGFGSSGFEMSWGAAFLVLELIKDVTAKL